MLVFKTNQFPTYSETFIVQNIIAAVQSGHKIKILVNRKNSLNNSSQSDLISKYCLMDDVISLKTIPKRSLKKLWHIVKDTFDKPHLVFIFLKFSIQKKRFNLNFFFLVKEYYQIFNAEVFHVHYCDQFRPLNDLISYGLIKGKIIVTFHGYDVELLSTKNKKDIPILNNFVYNFIANSYFTKEKLVQLGLDSRKITVIYNGVDVSNRVFQQKTLDCKSLRLISVGRLVEFKGHIYALKSILELIKFGLNIKYTIIGEGKELNNLIKFINTHNLENSVEILGKQTQAEIFDHLNHNNIFLFPSTVDSNGRMENFGVASIEAQLFGLPVICFNSGGVPETLKDGKTGFIVPDKDYKKMAEKILELKKNPELFRNMSQAARDHIMESFNYIDTFKKLELLYFK